MLKRIAQPVTALLLLTAFGPIDGPARIQQQPPHGWIPPSRPDTAPPPVAEPSRSAPFANLAPCGVLGDGSAKANRTFVEHYNRATQALRERNWAAAMADADVAIANARNRQTLHAAFSLRFQAANGLGDKTAASTAYEALKALDCGPLPILPPTP